MNISLFSGAFTASVKTHAKTRSPSYADTCIAPIEKSHLAICESFIKKREWMCVYLSERFVAFKAKLLNIEKDTEAKGSEFFMLTETPIDIAKVAEPRITGVLFVSIRGNVLHCLPPRVMQSKTWRQKLRTFFKGKKVASIMGEREANRFLERICGGIFFNKSDYIFMRRFRNAAEEAMPCPESAYSSNGAAAHTCSIKDADALLPLQIAYESEELEIQDNETASEKALMRLKSALRRQTILACCDTLTGKLLGKAGTNAKGMSWNQIGGVYTLPAERGKGIAAFMVSELAKLSAAEGKNAVLFAKNSNKAAQNAYAKSGFKECGAFRIAARG